ncbi:hypothetical protein [Paenibacillus sp. NPDC058174]|uniref:hypothetical protein n=1 Tax=Paenibacillus sp. NPDC058174 TaxID=3346366 RepID=UPI0036DCFCC9
MTGVALHGATIVESIKPNHVEYYVQYRQCGHYDEETGLCDSYYWTSPSPLPPRDAKITGTVKASSSNMKLNGAGIAKVGDKTIETWVVYPPIPANTNDTIYTTRGATSGSGEGQIITGSSKGKLDGQPIALIGSQVRTMLGTETTISNGNSKLSFNS